MVASLAQQTQCHACIYAYNHVYITFFQEECLPNPFPIPKFRVSTMQNFQNQLLTGQDRKYVVQTLVTVMMTHVQRPTLSECGIVAKSLIEKYNFLSDEEGTGEVSTNALLKA